MSTMLAPPAEHVLQLGVDRAQRLIGADRYDDALRALVVAGTAAELIQDETERLD